MKRGFFALIALLFIGFPYHLSCQNVLDSLLQASIEYLRQAESITADYDKQIQLARQAIKGFEQVQHDSLAIEARYLVARTAYYSKDSTLFTKETPHILQLAEARRDTAMLVRLYNLMGTFFFSISDPQKGFEILSQPDRLNYYSDKSLVHNVFNLGALVDGSMVATNSLDTVYYYVNKLQQLAQRYEDPNVQVVSKFKLAMLMSRSYNYEQALVTLKEAYPYLDSLEQKGFYHYYYRGLIDNFIQLQHADSARHYIKVLQEVASYPAGDPRNCYIIVSSVRASMEIGELDTLPLEFEVCLEQAITLKNKSKRVGHNLLNMLLVKCTFLAKEKQWKTLDALLPTFIKYATDDQHKDFLERAYHLRYQSFADRGMTEQALEAHILYKAYADKRNEFVFSQSESLFKNQLALQQVEDKNRILAIENQNQKLRIARDRNVLWVSVLGLLLSGIVVAYLVRQYRSRSQQSAALSALVGKKTQQLKSTNKTLATTNRELLKRNSELERFAFIVSHDLKTPLHNVIKFSGLLKAKLKANKTAYVDDYLGFIIDSGKRMNRLIEDVLVFARLSTADPEDEGSIIVLSDLIDDITLSIATYLESRKAVVEISAPLPHIRQNYSKMLMLFKNLIENGIKYNESAVPTVKIYGKTGQHFYSVFVEDNGIGIEPEFFDKVFQMFARLHPQTTYEGSGLGLAIAKKLVDEFGGQISLLSEPQTKTVFRIDIPQALIIE